MNTTARPARLRVLGLAALLAASTALTACGSDSGSDDEVTTGGTALFSTLPDAIQESGTVTLGALWETPPMIGVDPSDTSTPVGIAPELAAELGAELGVKIEWQNMQWPAQLPAVQSGGVDALFGQVSATEERETTVVDLIPINRVTMSLVLLAESASITGLADMCGSTIGVPVGATQIAQIKAVSTEKCGDDQIKIKEFQGATMAINAVLSGTTDAWMDITSSQEAAVDANAKLAAVTIPDAEVAPHYTAIAVSKKLPALSEALKVAMETVVEDGRYAEIMKKYDSSSAAVSLSDVVINPLTGTPAGQTK